MAQYPSLAPTFTTKTNKVDLVDAAHINAVQNEVVALATELGTNPSESRTTLKERLNSMMDEDGSLYSSNAFPDGVVAPSYPSQLFYRSDLDTLYVRNNANTAWTALGSSLSNKLYEWHGSIGKYLINAGVLSSHSDGGANQYQFINIYNSTAYATVLHFKFQKVSGINTITNWANLATDASGNFTTVKVTIGAVSGTLTPAGTSTFPAMVSGSLNVSALNNGTTYDVICEMKSDTNSEAFLYSIEGIAS